MATPAPARWDLVLVLALGGMAYGLSQSTVLPALHDIGTALGASPSAIGWVLSGYLVSAAVATAVIGRVGDMFGKRRTLVAALAVFVVGSLICTAATSLPMLVAGRVVQACAAGVYPLAFGIIRDEFPAHRLAAGVGLMSATMGIGGGLGPIVGGLLVDGLGFRWIFASIAVLGVVALVATQLRVPESPVRAAPHMDWLGIALMSAGLSAPLIAISRTAAWGWTGAPTLALVIGGLLLLAAWVLWERRVPFPLVDMAMLAHRPVALNCVMGVLLGIGMFAPVVLIPLLVQQPTRGIGFDLSATQAGLMLVPGGFATLFAAPIAGALGNRFGARLPMTIGAVLCGLPLLGLIFVLDREWFLVVALTFQGAGVGFALAAMAQIIVSSVHVTQTGIASGLNTITRVVGSAVGGQVAVSITSTHLIGGTPLLAADGFRITFALSACACVAAVIVGQFLPLVGKRVVTPVAIGGPGARGASTPG